MSHALIVAAVGIGLTLAPRPAAAKKRGPVQITPEQPKGKERREARRTTDDRSEAGTRRGILELTLGSVVAGTAGLLVGRGIWETVRAGRIEEQCAMGSEALECLTFDRPGRQARIAAGLNFGFAGVLGLASGFLLVRGVRIHRDWKRWHEQNARVQLRPWASVHGRGGGVSLGLRF